jgi:hypothetical protein
MQIPEISVHPFSGYGRYDLTMLSGRVELQIVALLNRFHCPEHPQSLSKKVY